MGRGVGEVERRCFCLPRLSVIHVAPFGPPLAGVGNHASRHHAFPGQRILDRRRREVAGVSPTSGAETSSGTPSSGPSDSVTGQQHLKPSELALSKLAAESSMTVWVSTPDEEKPGGRVAPDTTLVGGRVAPTDSRLATTNTHHEIPGSIRMKTGLEVVVGCGIARPAGDKQYLTEHFDRVLGQVGLSEEFVPLLIVTDDVPPMQRMFIAQVRDELGDHHVSPGPRNDTERIQAEYVSNENPHPSLFGVEPTQKIGMIHVSQRALTLVEAAGLRNRIPLHERVKMPIDLDGDTGDMCRDVMGRPTVARTHRSGVDMIDGREELVRLSTPVDHTRPMHDEATRTGLMESEGAPRHRKGTARAKSSWATAGRTGPVHVGHRSGCVNARDQRRP